VMIELLVSFLAAVEISNFQVLGTNSGHLVY
jgi:hypothetical protein